MIDTGDTIPIRKLQPGSELNLHLMELIDKQYTKRPLYGARQMTESLRRQGYRVNHKRVERLMRKMGIMAIYPRPRTSIKDDSHRVYPYLLRWLPVDNIQPVRIRLLSMAVICPAESI